MKLQEQRELLANVVHRLLQVSMLKLEVPHELLNPTGFTLAYLKGNENEWQKQAKAFIKWFDKNCP